MFYIQDIKDNKYLVVDTSDGVAEWVSHNDLVTLYDDACGIRIYNVSNISDKIMVTYPPNIKNMLTGFMLDLIKEHGVGVLFNSTYTMDLVNINGVWKISLYNNGKSCWQSEFKYIVEKFKPVIYNFGYNTWSILSLRMECGRLVSCKYNNKEI